MARALATAGIARAATLHRNRDPGAMSANVVVCGAGVLCDANGTARAAALHRNRDSGTMSANVMVCGAGVLCDARRIAHLGDSHYDCLGPLCAIRS